jgi:hypothetical protein
MAETSIAPTQKGLLELATTLMFAAAHDGDVR